MGNNYWKESRITNLRHYGRDRWLGIPPKDVDTRKTALVVFASQRQASKCAYVRTRIAYKGSFATHFHHYSKVKKEIVLSESDQNGDKEKKDTSSPSKSTSSPSKSSQSSSSQSSMK